MEGTALLCVTPTGAGLGTGAGAAPVLVVGVGRPFAAEWGRFGAGQACAHNPQNPLTDD